MGSKRLIRCSTETLFHCLGAPLVDVVVWPVQIEWQREDEVGRVHVEAEKVARAGNFQPLLFREGGKARCFVALLVAFGINLEAQINGKS